MKKNIIKLILPFLIIATTIISIYSYKKAESIEKPIIIDPSPIVEVKPPTIVEIEPPVFYFDEEKVPTEDDYLKVLTHYTNWIDNFDDKEFYLELEKADNFKMEIDNDFYLWIGFTILRKLKWYKKEWEKEPNSVPYIKLLDIEIKNFKHDLELLAKGTILNEVELKAYLDMLGEQ